MFPDGFLRKLEKSDRKYVLIVGTFHPNGYFRKRCMEALAKEKGALPFLLLRANDWVRPIRERAFPLIYEYLKQCDTEEILSSLPVLEKLQRSGRRSDLQMKELKDRIFVRLKQTLRSADWSKIWPEDFSVRKSLYRISMDMGLLTLEQMDDWLLRERNFRGRMILIKGILKHPGCTPAHAGIRSLYSGEAHQPGYQRLLSGTFEG